MNTFSEFWLWKNWPTKQFVDWTSDSVV